MRWVDAATACSSREEDNCRESVTAEPLLLLLLLAPKEQEVEVVHREPRPRTTLVTCCALEDALVEAVDNGEKMYPEA